MSDRDQRKRDVRVRIGRLRRRIDRRLRAAGDDARRIVSWRTYAARFPGNLLLGALGLGLALSAGWNVRRLAPWLGRRLLRRSLRQARKHVWNEFERIWAESKPRDRTGAAPEGDADG